MRVCVPLFEECSRLNMAENVFACMCCACAVHVPCACVRVLACERAYERHACASVPLTEECAHVRGGLAGPGGVGVEKCGGGKRGEV